MNEVLDTRFFIEHLYSTEPETKKKTAHRLKDLRLKQEGILPTIVVAEIVKVTCDRRGKDTAECYYEALIQSGMKIQDLTAEIAKCTGILKSKYRNISIGDCTIAATAIEAHARVLSDDPHFDAITEIKRAWI